MQTQMPQVLKGFRDFLPTEKRKRDFVMRKIVETFESFGFDPMETPTLEYRETIMGKYGEEADKLVYEFTDRGDRQVAMRYDQTVPTARVIANYQNDLPFPFRRYQVQNVFRADKPQKGRYREFTQCDIDIFGSKDILADAEILACVYAAYKNIGFKEVTLKVNDRQLLVSTLLPFETPSVSVYSIIGSLDKLDKMDKEEVQAELQKKGLTEESAKAVLDAIGKVKPSSQLTEILKVAKALGVEEKAIEFSPTTARGLDYYTGMIFEVIVPGFDVGSTGGGGRYDKLISDLSGIDVPAVGMAFGFDRTVEAAEALGLLSLENSDSDVLVTIFDQELYTDSAVLARKLRDQGLKIELYPKFAELTKQLKYADKKGMRYALILGSKEKENGEVLIKDLKSRTQESVKIEDVSAKLS
jgi:histidyl-tRNA synthetase